MTSTDVVEGGVEASLPTSDRIPLAAAMAQQEEPGFVVRHLCGG